ncbi:hypothetical protein AA0313_0533 [Acetobacter indonesiensis NRIC 0313]|uniref:Uncharacterized protein n=1 Tax=Acetobacter indonesiensis TaxID=104101 RepID=A0A6N3SZV0_9PROT|nr:hypothetical protein [Acetobacter indonesiensis]GAN62853.1 hypothetical protein Abin_015_139 [Acetobacter indonesiensis]GBQ54342.1 hypothetical protein AA0313_0533 [Acetobacter indonesiensis NRIC 0313]GEN02422.1 hypothetical protein AIN02nite_04470 [Acetobacter indonesiensis]
MSAFSSRYWVSARPLAAAACVFGVMTATPPEAHADDIRALRQSPPCDTKFLTALQISDLKQQLRLAYNLPAPSEATGKDDLDQATIVLSVGTLRPQHRDVVAYILSNSFCGTAGCATTILADRDDRTLAYPVFRVMTARTVVHLPITKLPTQHNGWPDLTVQIAGGGILQGYAAPAYFNGTTYTVDQSVHLGAITNGHSPKHGVPLLRDAPPAVGQCLLQ